MSRLLGDWFKSIGLCCHRSLGEKIAGVEALWILLHFGVGLHGSADVCQGARQQRTFC